MEILDPDKTAQPKTFPNHATLNLTLYFSPDAMAKVQTWYAKTRQELGDKHLEEITPARMIFEAFSGGAVHPDVVKCEVEGSYGEN